MHPLQTLVSRPFVFAVIVLTLLLLYFALASLFWQRGRHFPVTGDPPLANGPEPVSKDSTSDEAPDAIITDIAANLDKLLADRQSTSISRDALLKKLLRSERFKG